MYMLTATRSQKDNMLPHFASGQALGCVLSKWKQNKTKQNIKKALKIFFQFFRKSRINMRSTFFHILSAYLPSSSLFKKDSQCQRRKMASCASSFLALVSALILLLRCLASLRLPFLRGIVGGKVSRIPRLFSHVLPTMAHLLGVTASQIWGESNLGDPSPLFSVCINRIVRLCWINRLKVCYTEKSSHEE